jgi:hypothetical protein
LFENSDRQQFSLRKEEEKLLKISAKLISSLAMIAFVNLSGFQLTLSDVVVRVSVEYFIRMLIAKVLFSRTLLKEKKKEKVRKIENIMRKAVY